jgi:hypothetical protein
MNDSNTLNNSGGGWLQTVTGLIGAGVGIANAVQGKNAPTVNQTSQPVSKSLEKSDSKLLWIALGAVVLIFGGFLILRK